MATHSGAIGRSKVLKRLLSTGFILFMGHVFGLGGCGGAREGFDPNIPIQADADIPENLARHIRACAAEHRTHLGSVNHSIAFDVTFASDGEVGEMTLLGSTLRDEGLEACMASALRSLSEDDLPLYGSDRDALGAVAPESHALLGQQPIPLPCIYSPPCLLTLTLLAGITSITMLLYVHNIKTLPSPAPAPPVAPLEPEAPRPEPKPLDKPIKTVDPPPPPPPPLPPRETCEEMRPEIIRCDDRAIRWYSFRHENAAFNEIIKIVGDDVRKSAKKKDTRDGPCVDRGGFHTNVLRGSKSVATIVGCDCCEDSSGKAEKKMRAGYFIR